MCDKMRMIDVIECRSRCVPLACLDMNWGSGLPAVHSIYNCIVSMLTAEKLSSDLKEMQVSS